MVNTPHVCLGSWRGGRAQEPTLFGPWSLWLEKPVGTLRRGRTAGAHPGLLGGGGEGVAEEVMSSSYNSSKLGCPLKQ